MGPESVVAHVLGELPHPSREDRVADEQPDLPTPRTKGRTGPRPKYRAHQQPNPTYQVGSLPSSGNSRFSKEFAARRTLGDCLMRLTVVIGHPSASRGTFHVQTIPSLRYVTEPFASILIAADKVHPESNRRNPPQTKKHPLRARKTSQPLFGIREPDMRNLRDRDKG